MLASPEGARHTLEPYTICPVWGQVLTPGPTAICKQTAMSPSGPKEPVVERQSSDGQSDDLTGRTLRLRIRQQELLAELGVLALQGTSFIEMLNHTARITAEGLRAEYCKVMEFLPAENRLVVRAGVGWEEGVVGHATVG